MPRPMAVRPGSNKAAQGLGRPRMASDGNHRAERTKRQAVAAKSGGGVLMVDDTPDVRQTVGGLDDLTGPAVDDLDARD